MYIYLTSRLWMRMADTVYAQNREARAEIRRSRTSDAIDSQPGPNQNPDNLMAENTEPSATGDGHCQGTGLKGPKA